MSVELLAPAGSFESLKYALEAGADSVYFGLSGYNARNKTEDVNMQEWIELCHVYAAKAYIAVNILIKDNEIHDVVSKIVKCHNLGADAFIICDFGLISILHDLYPNINIHLSTQAGIFEKHAILYLKKHCNIKRIVLPREMTMNDAKCVLGLGIEIEVFCHGAMCVGYSGSCYMSSILSANSGNRGRCQQFCRKGYKNITTNSISQKSYLLSSKDLCTISDIDKLMVFDSLKIEGRLKRAEYVGEVTSIYKNAIINKSYEKGDISRLKRIFSRGEFTNGYLLSPQKHKLIYKHLQSSLGEYVGKIISVENQYCICDYKNFTNLDGLKIIRDNKEVGHGTYIEKIKKIAYSGDIKKCDLVHITTDNRQLLAIKSIRKKVPISFQITLNANERAILRTNMYSTDFVAFSSSDVQVRTNLLREDDTIKTQLSKLGDSMYYLDKLDIYMKEPCFISKSELNAMRRNIINQINTYLIERQRNTQDVLPIYVHKKKVFENKKFYAIADNIDVAKYLKSTNIYQDIILHDIDISNDCSEYYLYLPHFLHIEDIDYIKKHVNKYKGVYANNLYGALLHENVIIGDMNIFNSYSYAFVRNFSKNIVLSFEMNSRQIEDLSFDTMPIIRTLGRLPLMQLNHCPYSVSSDNTCTDCKYNASMKYQDEYNETFIIKRMKFVNCYFYLYNSKMLKIEDTRYHELHDFSCMNVEDIKNIEKSDFTKGHYLRGVK